MIHKIHVEKFVRVTFYCYFCRMNNKWTIIVLSGVVLVLLALLWWRAPVIGGSLTKQTIYLWVLDSWRGQTDTPKARVMLVDDDSEKGIFKIRRICDDLGIKAAFAVIPARIKNALGDSLCQWQKEGFGICLHGYDHNQWREWSYDEIVEDIRKSEESLSKSGFMIDRIKYVVPPHASNTHAIRKAVEDKGYQMIMGANIVNPDTEAFQLGRVSINKGTELKKMETILRKAKKRQMFVILGTHSSNSSEFSEEKTRGVLLMAKNMGFEFYH